MDELPVRRCSRQDRTVSLSLFRAFLLSSNPPRRLLSLQYTIPVSPGRNSNPTSAVLTRNAARIRYAFGRLSQ